MHATILRYFGVILPGKIPGIEKIKYKVAESIGKQWCKSNSLVENKSVSVCNTDHS